ncbi:hypothetical protein LWM68_23925 [Niabella sp. W65]|nr:hypothetical protein [Niabella sp. W65]MCH7365551.1 hypothetical protein [Niabella sp. W65]ULT41331.1 hypothetical protein KRR40_42805 [Niabella sp. I65]
MLSIIKNNRYEHNNYNRTPLISAEELLTAWQGHRNLTRKVIEVFPEKDMFTFSVGGMRPLPT